jgi:hypothetical protein
MLPGILAVLMVGGLAGSVESGAGRGYPVCDRGCYGDHSGYRAYSGCGGYDDCGRRGGYGGYDYRGYDYRGYERRGYSYGGYDYSYAYRDRGYGGYGE